MSEANDQDTVYAAPASPVADVERSHRWASRFWTACVVCGIAYAGAVSLFVYVADIQSVSVTAFVVLLMACWMAPAFWILLPTIRQDGLRRLSVKRLLSTLFGFAIVTTMLTLVLFFLLLLTLVFVEALKSPGMFGRE